MRTAVLGSGSWGTALARLLGLRDHEVTLWARSEEDAKNLAEKRENTRYLPGAMLPPQVSFTSDLARALSGAAQVIVALPSAAVRETLARAAPFLDSRIPIVSASKGMEVPSCRRISEIIRELLPGSPVAILSGPSFAKEVVRDVFTAVVVASVDADVARGVQATFSSERFRVYTSEDVVGVEIGGALKNVIAVAAGCADGLGAGHNARAALITRGLAEMARLAERLGGNPRTLAGLAGLGDLVLTCTSDLSRNRRLGMDLARGRALEDVLADLGQVAESVSTVRSAYALAQRLAVEMPITEQVHQVLCEAQTPEKAVRNLIARTLRPELD